MPTANPSRRSRIAALAATADYNPEEAAVAQAILDRTPLDLDAIAESIRAEYGKGIESSFAIGRLLSEAAALFPPHARHIFGPGKVGKGSPYGDWFRAQNFPFTAKTSQLLRAAYARESEVRALIESRAKSTTSADIGVVTAIGFLTAKPKAPLSVPTEETTPADPAFAALRAARNALLGWDGERTTHNAFTGMFVDDLRESGLIIKALADAYTEARNARG